MSAWRGLLIIVILIVKIGTEMENYSSTYLTYLEINLLLTITINFAISDNNNVKYITHYNRRFNFNI